MADQMLRVSTRMGPVGLRERRRGFPMEIQVSDENSKSGDKLMVGRQWLDKFAPKKKAKGDDTVSEAEASNEAKYHRAIKQAMLIAARTVDINDGLDPVPEIEETLSSEELQYQMALKAKGSKIEEYKKKIELLKLGREPISVAGHKRILLKDVLPTEERPRDMLVKYSTRGCCYKKRHRYFIFEDGKLIYYKNRLPIAKPCFPFLNLHEAKVFTENFVQGYRQEPEFEQGFESRLKVEFTQRMDTKKNPLYLYPKDKRQMNNWKRTFQLARVLVTPNDRKTMATAVGRSVNALLIKGWESLFWYQKEMKDTRALVQQMSMRLIKVDISRGWTKMKLVWTKDKNEQKRKLEMQEFAARFLSERLARLGTQAETPLEEVRESVVSKIQERFRAFREEAIFDRRYPITPKHSSRMSQALAGVVKDVALEALECKDVLKLSIDLDDKETWDEIATSPESFTTRASTYTEATLNPSSRLVSMADNLQSLTFASSDAGIGNAKADMSDFVNVDRISQVVMNSAPQLSIARAPEKGDEGVWCSVYGPRVAYGKRLDITKNADTQTITNFPVGAKDGFSLARALGGDKTEKLQYASLEVKVLAADWDLTDPKKQKQKQNKVDDEDELVSSKMHVHLLGYRFSSNEASGDGKSFSFPGPIQAVVPLAANDDKASAILDQSPVVVEVVQTYKPKETKNNQKDNVAAQPYCKQVLVGHDTLGNMFGIGVGGSKKADYSKRVQADIALLAPEAGVFGAQKDLGRKGSLKVDISSLVKMPTQIELDKPISPEFYGAGIPTSLYTSHRAAWFDSSLGLGRFRLDRVANFVELSLKNFRFPPPTDKEIADKKIADKEICTYRIRAKVNGITAVSQPRHRSKEEWQKVLGRQFADPGLISFEGERLCLPLPAGCWGSLPEDGSKAKRGGVGGRPIVEIEVVKATPYKSTKKTYETFFAKPTGSTNAPKDEVVYYSALTFDEALVDETLDVSVFFGDATAGGDSVKKQVLVSVEENIVVDGTATEGLLNVEFTLRDRDVVRATGSTPGKERTLCVGDKALMEVEEPLYFPASKQEMKMRFGGDKYEDKEKNEWPKEWPKYKKDKTDKNEKGKDRGKELRDPALSAEYAASGLSEQIPKVKFRPGVIPSHCQDIFPHKFALPYTEAEFLEARYPGVWPHILDDLVENSKKADLHSGIPRKPLVTHLKRHVRTIPVTLLAVYPDGTCAVEIAPSFMETWRRQPKRTFDMPGEFVPATGDGQTPKLTLRNVTPAEKGAPELQRAILKKVPTITLRAMHSTGFHTYDASFKGLDDYAKSPAPVPDFNPMGVVEESIVVPDSPSRSKSLEDLKALAKSERLIIAAGPLPPDASSAACQYEWVLHVRSKNAHEMCSFVAMLRQCKRLEHFNTTMRTAQALAHEPIVEEVPRNIKMVGGQLEIVLVEARRLPPVGIHEAVHKAKEHIEQLSDSFDHESNKLDLKGTTSGAIVRSTPPGAAINTFVSMRLYADGKIMPLKGQNVQHSPAISSTNSPCWAEDKSMSAQGGFTFRTGHIDPEKLGDAFLEFEVEQETLGTTQTIGVVHLGVTKAPCLVDPSAPFKDCWLPLTKKISTSQGESFVKHKTGEIHVMTRWVTAEQSALSAPMPVKSQLLKELWPKINAQRVKEPVYGIEPQYWHYNPNLVRQTVKEESDVQEGKKGKVDEPKKVVEVELDPETPPAFRLRHTVELYTALKYMECLEKRQIDFWDAFEKRLGDAGHSDVHLGNLKMNWMHRGDHAHLSQLHELVEAGIPSPLRERKWLELSGATYTMYGDQSADEATPEQLTKTARQTYERFVTMGVPQSSDANKQLAEDGFHLSGWESGCPAPLEALDFHLRRIKTAQQICLALIADEKANVAYCESLLVVAFFLSLPQGCSDRPEVVNEPMDDSSAFWLLRALANGAYQEYYGKPQAIAVEDGSRPSRALCVTSGAMNDIFLLECCLAYHAPDLWMFLHRIGFQMATVFYGAFMRLFATYMPTATVFRFWDILIASSTDPHIHPHQRVYLIDLAFGVLRSLKADILQCESAFDVKTCILGGFGAIYDQSTVVEITLHAHRYLWGGTGLASGKVLHLFQQRTELFKKVEETLHGQNKLLKQMTHETTISNIGMQRADSQKGTSTNDVKRLLPGIIDTLASTNASLIDHEGKPVELPKYWTMHRPMPLVGQYLNEGTLEQTLNKVKEMVKGEVVEPIPIAVVPPKLTDAARAKLVYPDPDPVVTNATQFREVVNMHCQSWAGFTQELWYKFSNRIDLEAERINQLRHERDPYAEHKKRDWSNLFGFIENGPEHYVRKQKADIAKLPLEWQREKISMNEIYASMIICSRGTLGDKANNLFNIYSYISPFFNPSNPPLHRQPIAKVARSITAAQDSAGDQKNMTAPEPDAEKENALHFSVYSNYPTKRTLVGDVYIGSLGSYLAADSEYAESQFYNIWGPKPDDVQKNQPHNKNKNKNSNVKEDTHNSKEDTPLKAQGSMQSTASNLTSLESIAAKDKVCLGEIEMSVAWMPAKITEPHKGQLCVQIKAIRFYKMYITDPHKKNPYVELKTYRRGKAERISRWDIQENTGNVITNMMHNVAHRSEHMYWAPTLGEGFFGQPGENLKQKHNDQGWNSKDGGEWVWNKKEGKQFSAKLFEIEERFLNLAMRKNVMDIMGARNLVCTILNRSVLQLSNRQQLLIADSIFNRGGAVPGILEAVLVAKSQCPTPVAPSGNIVADKDIVNLNDMKKKWTKMSDVSNEIGLEHERQIRATGSMNMFKLDYGGPYFKDLDLKGMGIKDSFGKIFTEKVLWIKYIRGGDGEHCTQGVVFNSSGKLETSPNPEIMMDLVDSWPQSKITKDEFISCMLNSSLLGESIRRIGATDHDMQPRKSIALDVTIMDPHHLEFDTMFQDAINVQQSILLELWDADVVSKDFLGECWLPPLQDLTSQEKDYVLKVKPADFSEGAERGPSRKPTGTFSASKEVDQSSTDPNKKITGDLQVRLAWVYPAYDFDEETGECSVRGEKASEDENEKGDAPEKIADRAEIQEKLHTGRLTLKIIKATRLRRADAGKLSSRDCDPQVTAWIRNDKTMMWKERYLDRTSVVKNNRNPVWKDEFKKPFEILSGDFEARFEEEDTFLDKVKDVFKSSKTKREEDEDEDVAKLNRFAEKGLKLKFAEKESDLPGMNIIAKQKAEKEKEAANSKKDDQEKKKEEPNATDGTNHTVEVFLGDSIREFKVKCTQACEQECNYWKKRGVSYEDKANKYLDVNIGFKHLVMAFVPTPKVTQLAAQGLTSGRDYHHAYHVAFQDPSNWEPLDPARTFQQYPQYGFGRNPNHIPIKIVEATESYKLVNLRYKEFEKKQNVQPYSDVNTAQRCFGYAKYVRKSEEGSKRDFEWKPAFISTDEAQEQKSMRKSQAEKTKDKSKYKVQWVLQPFVGASAPKDGINENVVDDIEKEKVMFHPRCALVNDNFLDEHRAVLDNATELRKMGKNDFEIQKVLNDMIVQSDKDSKNKDKKKVPPITVDIIRSYIQFKEAKASLSNSKD